MKKVDLSIIIVSFNTNEITAQCIESIYKSKFSIEIEIIVIDNNSIDGTKENIRQRFPNLNLIELNENIGFSRANNIGIDKSTGKYILLLNSDTILFETSLQDLYDSTVKNGYDICAPILLNSDLTIQRSWFDFPSSVKIFLRLTEWYRIILRFSKSNLLKRLLKKFDFAFLKGNIVQDSTVSYLSFACILINSNVIKSIGKLDENLMFYHEDCEFGIRANKNNLQLVYNTASKIIHLGGTSSSKTSLFSFENDIRGLLYVYKKHYKKRKFLFLKLAVIIALLIRYLFWFVGFYRSLNKLGLYKNVKNTNKNESGTLRKKYLELIYLSICY
ncbi:MAG: hypothetical protein RLZZ65_476 [Bacteroidota bacterium]